MKNCSFCNLTRRTKTTEFISPIYGFFDYIPQGFYKNNQNPLLHISSSEKESDYYIPIKYCPFCQRNLSKKYVHNNKQDYSSRIRKNIKKNMSKEGLSIDELAKRTGISQTDIEKYLAKEQEDLSAGEIGIIAEILAIPIEELYEG